MYIIKRLVPLALLVLALALSACSGSMGGPVKSPAPTSSPKPTAAASASPEASASPDVSESTQPSPDASGEPAGSEKTGSLFGLEGFVEGAVVDPADVPELTKLISEDARFKDMTIQSVTYKTVDEREAYYVVLQGDGEASHPIYVFADGTIREGGM